MKTFLQKIKLMIPAAIAFIVPGSAMAVVGEADVRKWKLGLFGMGATPTTFELVIARAITAFLGLAGIIAVGYLIAGGLSYLTAGGDAEKAGAGKTTIIHAIVGMIIIFSAYLIFNYVLRGLGGGRVPLF